MRGRKFSIRIVCTADQKKAIAQFRRDPKRPRMTTVFSANSGVTRILVLSGPIAFRDTFVAFVESLGIKHQVADQWSVPCSE